MERVAALLIVDVQNDFCPGGALAVPDGDRVAGPLSQLAERFAAEGLPIVATRDWHPPRTRHFKDFGGIWPPHCIRGTPGAAFHPTLRLPPNTVLISKGTEPDADSYSAFDGTTEQGRPLAELLEQLGVRRLYIGGLATDYCVRSSVLDALQRGLSVTVLLDCIEGVDLRPGDSKRALEEMRAAGAQFCLIEDLLSGDASQPTKLSQSS